MKDGGSWTGGEVTLMAEEERAAMKVSDFAEWDEWARETRNYGGGEGDQKERGSSGSGGSGSGSGSGSEGGSGGESVCLEGDPLAAHMHPVPLL